LDKAFYVFLRFFDMTLQKNVKSRVFLDFQKNIKRILELWLSILLFCVQHNASKQGGQKTVFINRWST